MTYWILPANPKTFRMNSCIARYGDIYWQQHNNIKVGDIVYMYTCKPVQRITHKMEVIESDLPYSPSIERGREYWIETSRSVWNRYLHLKPIKAICSDDLSLTSLLEHGLKGVPQGALKVNDELCTYIEECFIDI